MNRGLTSKQATSNQSGVCPFLGLREDPSLIAARPTSAHACHSGAPLYPLTSEHQRRYCMTSGYGRCAGYVVPAAQGREIRREREAVRAGTRTRSLRDRNVNLLYIILALVILGLFTVNAIWIFSPIIGNSAAGTATPTSLVQATDEAVPVDVPVILAEAPPEETGPQENVGAIATERYATPTPVPGGGVREIVPQRSQVGWWSSNGEEESSLIGDSFLYAGMREDQTYISAVQFDLTRLPRGASIHYGSLRLTGLRDTFLDRESSKSWLVQLVAENELADLSGSTFLSVYSAPASVTLLPSLNAAELGAEKTNEWVFDENTRRWLEQQLLSGAESVVVRIHSSADSEPSLFAWDSGLAEQSGGKLPSLVVGWGEPPAEEPPLPTRPVLVATATPLPENVMTVVALAQTATAAAEAYGTNTPVTHEIWTPTPIPENLETVQANAIAQGLPPVLLNTPVPANAATVESHAAYATAVAMTTGTFTPVPTGYVTPMIYYPPPPPENVATAAAQVAIATRQAESGVPPTPLPWNAVPAIYVYATPTPENEEEANALIQQRNLEAITIGTPTPTPWNMVVITAVPPPTPTPVPTISLAIPVDELEPTPTATPTRTITEGDFELVRNKILFLSNRSGTEAPWVLDPATGEVLFLLTDRQIYDMARQRFLTTSPDGTERAIVEADSRRDLQIQVYSETYQVNRQLTYFQGAMSYDPTWSPTGEWIAFVSNASGGDEIYVVDPYGDAVERLTFNTWEWDKHPTWSPDGTQIAFMSNRDSGRRQIWIMDANGNNQRNLSNDEYENWDPIWVR